MILTEVSLSAGGLLELVRSVFTTLAAFVLAVVALFEALEGSIIDSRLNPKLGTGRLAYEIRLLLLWLIDAGVWLNIPAEACLAGSLKGFEVTVDAFTFGTEG